MSMNLTTELQYLHDKLVKVDVARLDIYLLNSLRGYIKSGCGHPGFKHDFEWSLGKCQEEARVNRYGKEMFAQVKDLDIFYCANEFYYATMLTHNAIGTKNQDIIAKNQSVRIVKAKKVLDIL